VLVASGFKMLANCCDFEVRVKERYAGPARTGPGCRTPYNWQFFIEDNSISRKAAKYKKRYRRHSSGEVVPFSLHASSQCCRHEAPGAIGWRCLKECMADKKATRVNVSTSRHFDKNHNARLGVLFFVHFCSGQILFEAFKHILAGFNIIMFCGLLSSIE